MSRVAVLGTGTMGAGMARSMLRAGLEVTVWNRSPDRATLLTGDGARVAGTPAEAVAGVDAVVTMLWDGDSVAEVMTGALPAAPAGVLWAQTSTVSVHDAGGRHRRRADGRGEPAVPQGGGLRARRPGHGRRLPRFPRRNRRGR